MVSEQQFAQTIECREIRFQFLFLTRLDRTCLCLIVEAVFIEKRSKLRNVQKFVFHAGAGLDHGGAFSEIPRNFIKAEARLQHRNQHAGCMCGRS